MTRGRHPAKTWVALFRGINVLGRRVLPMKDLKTLMVKNGCRDVQTYIQSGNVVFRSPLSNAAKVEWRLREAVERSHGFAPHVLALTRRDLEKAAAGNPFPEAVADHKSVHVFFLAATPERPDTIGPLRRRREEEYVHALVVGDRLREGIAGRRLLEIAACEREHVRGEAVAPLHRLPQTPLHLGRIGEWTAKDDVAALDVGLNIPAAVLHHQRLEVLHGQDPATQDVDPAEQRDPGLSRVPPPRHEVSAPPPSLGRRAPRPAARCGSPWP